MSVSGSTLRPAIADIHAIAMSLTDEEKQILLEDYAFLLQDIEPERQVQVAVGLRMFNAIVLRRAKLRIRHRRMVRSLFDSCLLYLTFLVIFTMSLSRYV